MIRFPRESTTGRSSGFTLTELLVAVLIFTILGLMIVTTMQATLTTWRSGEGEREAYEGARRVLEEVGLDLQLAYPTRTTEGSITHGFFGGRAAGGAVFLLFVASFSERDENALTRAAGTGSVADGSVDYYTGGDDRSRRLRALDGLVEVLYYYDPTGRRLLRARRSPIGGTGSLFDPANLGPGQIVLVSRVVATDVLHFDVLFWGPETTTWDRTVSSNAGGPLHQWDSSCARSTSFPYRGHPVARAIPDGFYPSKVRVTIVTDAAEGISRSRLLDPIEPGTTSIPLESTRGIPAPEPGRELFVRVGDEWMGYTRKNSFGLSGVQRGLRGSTARSHPSGTPVRLGREFVHIHQLAIVRTLWGTP